MVSKNTLTTLGFGVAGIAVWYASGSVTQQTTFRIGVLILVGVLVPTLINEWRDQKRGTAGR